MRDELAERALAALLDWDEEQVADRGARLQLLAGIKYDEYEGYRPGEKFLEKFVATLAQLDSTEQSLVADYVLEDLIFVSRSELFHAIEIVYPDIIRPELLKTTATQLRVSPHKIKAIVNSSEFWAAHRSTLIIGLSDGARLDKLRRVSDLTTEQFVQGPEIAQDRIDTLTNRLRQDLLREGSDEPPLFKQVFLVEDFTGSSFTLLHPEGNDWDGKLIRARNQIKALTDQAFSSDVRIHLILYAAGSPAVANLKTNLRSAGVAWPVSTVVTINHDQPRDFGLLEKLARDFFDWDQLNDEHMKKGGPNPHLGFGGYAYPLVLHHNAPNSSICFLWADTAGEPDSQLQRHALFPRVRRHRT